MKGNTAVQRELHMVNYMVEIRFGHTLVNNSGGNPPVNGNCAPKTKLRDAGERAKLHVGEKYYIFLFI